MKNDVIKVTHISGSVSREAGGLFESVRHLSQETTRHNVTISVLSVEDSFTKQDLPLWAPLPVQIYPVIGPKRFGWSPEMGQHLKCSDAEIVHLHGVWQYATVAVLRWARQTGRPFLVSPHGMLEPWALKHSRYKKAIANWLFQKSCLNRAACLRATADLEIQSIRQAGFNNPVALIPNGVPFPATLPEREPRTAKRRRRALFVSRIHPKKGLLNLVSAWNRLQKSEIGPRIAEEWELALVGPDEGGHLAEVMGAVKAYGLEGQISYLGQIWDAQAKLKCYVNSDLFVLPTFSENFGLVIAEALSCSVPVITTKAAPWEELETLKCGWWIDTGEEPVYQALRAALGAPPETLREMGRRGRELVRDKYSWARPGRQMAEVYEWLVGRRSRPDYVY